MIEHVQLDGGENVSAFIASDVQWADLLAGWATFTIGTRHVYDAQPADSYIVALEMEDEVHVGDPWHFVSDQGQADPPLAPNQSGFVEYGG